MLLAFCSNLINVQYYKVPNLLTTELRIKLCIKANTLELPKLNFLGVIYSLMNNNSTNICRNRDHRVCQKHSPLSFDDVYLPNR